MRVRLEVESDQIGMPAEGVLLVALSEANYIEIETGVGWVHLGIEQLRQMWHKLRTSEETKKLVQIH